MDGSEVLAFDLCIFFYNIFVMHQNRDRFLTCENLLGNKPESDEERDELNTFVRLR